MRGKIETLIVSGDITAEDLVEAVDLFERAKLVRDGLEACKQTISFQIGEKKVQCYFQKCKEDNEEYNVWGECDISGDITFCSNKLGKHYCLGSCRLLNFGAVFNAFWNERLSDHLRRFLNEQIEKANSAQKTAED